MHLGETIEAPKGKTVNIRLYTIEKIREIKFKVSVLQIVLEF